MEIKGSKYAHKQIMKNNKNSQPHVSRFTFVEDGRFLDVIYNDTDFLDIFNSLPLPDQIKAYRILKNLSKQNDDKHLSASDKQLATVSLHKLEAINKSAGLKIDEKQHYPLSANELHIIRMDCYGAINIQPPYQLSCFYKNLIHHPLPQKQQLKNYDLNDAPSWQLFRQFSSFRTIEPAVKHYLWQKCIDPQILQLMDVRDFSDLLFKTFRKDEKQTKVFFSEKGTPRNNFVKALERKFGRQIAEILRREKLDERYIQSLLNAMRMFGKTDIGNLIIMETHFTPKVLTDLQKAGINTETYQIGEKIPLGLVENLINADQGDLLAARDETGAVLQKNSFPSFQVHHINAIVESGELANIVSVNYRNNYLLLPADLHCHVFHGFDRLIVSGKKEAYSRRLELLNKNITFMYGFRKDQQIEYDWTKSKSFRKQEEEDNRYTVSYEEIRARLAENRMRYMNNSRSVEFDVDSVVQIIRHKKALDSSKNKNRKHVSANTMLKNFKKMKAKDK